MLGFLSKTEALAAWPATPTSISDWSRLKATYGLEIFSEVQREVSKLVGGPEVSQHLPVMQSRARFRPSLGGTVLAYFRCLDQYQDCLSRHFPRVSWLALMANWFNAGSP